MSFHCLLSLKNYILLAMNSIYFAQNFFPGNLTNLRWLGVPLKRFGSPGNQYVNQGIWQSWSSMTDESSKLDRDDVVCSAPRLSMVMHLSYVGVLELRSCQWFSRVKGDIRAFPRLCMPSRQGLHPQLKSLFLRRGDEVFAYWDQSEE